jgi:oligoribonuclease NrnB/cAMP/cGMP phosphodiesterase (DHH superfamily)
MSQVCFYHSADLDGLCSGALMALALPQAKMLPLDYGDEFPFDEIKGQDVYMADVSLQPFEGMLAVAALANSFTWIDHHKSAMDEHEKWRERISYHRCLPGVRRLGAAACELTWEYFQARNSGLDEIGLCGDSMPRAVRLLGRYDVWAWQNEPGAIEFQYGMRLDDWSYVRSTLWERLFRGELVDSLIARGADILAYQEQQNKITAQAGAFETEIGGLRAIACNAGPPCNSQLFDSVYDPLKHDVMVPFRWSKKGHWKVSLYTTKNDVDCASVAKSFGGGGHRQAAGFLCSALPFNLKK